jgi:hypothetical protein
MFFLTRSKIRALTIGIALLAALPANAHANMLLGLESNAEFTNSDRVPALQDPAIEKAQGLGAQVIRGNVNWADVAYNCGGQTLNALAQSTNPCYRWDVLDNLVHESNRLGIQLIFSVSRSPIWVNNNTNNMYVGSTSAQFNNFVKNYTAFIKAIGARYSPSSPYGVVKMWTIWNEPNSVQFWSPIATKAAQASAPIRYAALYAKAAVALRSVNRAALIAPGPTGPSPRVGVKPGTYIMTFQKYAMKYLPGSLTAKRSYINAWAHNPYPYVRSARDTSTKFSRLKFPNLPIQRTRDLIRVLDASPLTRGRSIWATEFGYETAPVEKLSGVAQSLQGRLMAEAFDVLDATGRVSVAIWYGMTDPVDPIDWQSGSYLSNGKIKPGAYWQRRPISVSRTRALRGTKVQVWAKSAVKPKLTRIQLSTNGRTWKTILGIKRRADGSIRANIKVTAAKTWFRTFDTMAGPSILVVGK